MSDLNEVGTGTNLPTNAEVRGVARWFNDTSDVLSGSPRVARAPSSRRPGTRPATVRNRSTRAAGMDGNACVVTILSRQ